MRKCAFLAANLTVFLGSLLTIAASGQTLEAPTPARLGRLRTLSAALCPLFDEVGPVRTDRFVGIFYFLTHSGGDAVRGQGKGPYDVSKILAQDSQATKKPQLPLWGPLHSSHYWGEPLYGYYRSTDPWVLRRHGPIAGRRQH